MSIESFFSEGNLLSLIIRFCFNLVVLYVLIGLIYYRFSKKSEFLFSFFIMGIIIFLICSILDSVEIQLGMALGLFAIFSILRFRTVNYSVKDMTYIFAVIGVSVINSLGNIPPPVASALIINVFVLVGTLILELFLHNRAFTTLVVIYDNLQLVTTGPKQDLLKDLSEQTGEKVEKVSIQKLDISRGIAEIEVYFRRNNRGNNN